MSVAAGNHAAREAATARPAIRGGIDKLKRAAKRHGGHTLNGSVAPKAELGDEPIASAQASTSIPMSTPCEPASSDSKKHWRKPRTLREFAAQANEIATLVLNDGIDIERARNYAALARVVSQAASIEVTRSRFLKREPDLSLD